jgi:acyl carrier protein
MDTKTIDHQGNLKQLPSKLDIQTWIVNYVAELLEVKPDQIDTAIAFDRYGLDSSAAVGLAGDLEDWLERELDPTLLYDYPTIESLSEHLMESLSESD